MANKSLPIKGKKYDHPEHHRDKIVEHCSEGRYVPEHLKDFLLEQSGHRCSICSEASFEFHHIQFLEDDGKTTYQNLIVLCPNCHARVHREGIPSKKQLHQYKLKQEVSYGLPIVDNLSSEEKKFICGLSEIPEDERVQFLDRHHDAITAKDDIEARKRLRKNVGLLYLQAEGIIQTEYDICIQDSDGTYHLSLIISVTDKGLRWIKYLVNSKLIELFG